MSLMQRSMVDQSRFVVVGGVPATVVPGACALEIRFQAAIIRQYFGCSGATIWYMVAMSFSG